ncbi:MBL fold metallo-hydrolase [Acinetobacter ursingii]|uniref:MBL fold metallo-hydrolase n=1 Tax=Acinetobacter ursingii TaxID=108980 RepID=UPI00124FC49E|nr:MBL fold metallo-hydrolase [Acinetobacter ursingii]
MKEKPTLTYQLPTQSCWTHTWSKPPFRYADSEHASSNHFHNQIKRSGAKGSKELLRWLATRESFTWQVDIQQEYESRINTPIGLPKNRPNADMDDWQVWFVGHATVLIQIGPFNFLTDPVWCEYASPLQGRGPRRVCPAGIALEQLPTIHGVLLSHNHYDHMDLATLHWLHQKFAMPIYTGLGNRYYLSKDFHVIEMDWWQMIPFHDEVTIAYTPAQHGSGRGLRDQNKALWGGFSLITQKGHCFFAGDTAYSPHFKEIHERFGDARIALLPIGAYEPRQLMHYVHMNPQDALHAHLDLQAHRSMAIHYRTFQLTDESRDEPEQELSHLLKTSSKFVNPFYCIKEGHKLTV